MPIMIFMTRYYHSSQHTHGINSAVPFIFKILSITLLTLGMVSVTSCEENPTSIGNNILPSSDFVEILSIDTLSAFSYTVYEDSVRSDNPSISYMGDIYDPYFGTTSTGFVTQIRMFPEWDDLPFTIDSVKLYLRLLQSKGGTDSEILHTIRLSEIAEQIYTDKPYYSNIQVPLTGYEVTDIKLPTLKADTINNVVIKLPNSFGAYICRDTSMLFYSNSKPDFRSYFKGLYFQIDPSADHLITSISLINESPQYYNNAVKIFMSNDDGTNKAYTFALDAVNKNAAYNIYKHDLSTAEPDKKIKHINDGYRDTLSYIQYLNGVYTKIEFPGLEVLKQNGDLTNIAINKARLTVPGYFDGDLYKPSKAPAQLLLRYKTNTGDTYIVPDYYVDQYHIFYNGTIDTTAKEYSFNLATFFQQYLEDAAKGIKPELEMFQGAGTSNIILKTSLGKPPVRFDFTYTRF
jgi:hypothetical protein